MKKLLSFLRPKRKLTPRERLVGALGGGGGGLISSAITLRILFPPSEHVRPLIDKIDLGFVIVGSIMVALGAIIYYTGRKKELCKALAGCLILLIATPYISPLVWATTATQTSLQISLVASEKAVNIQNHVLNMTIEEVSSTHIRLIHYVNNSEIIYDILLFNSSEVAIFANNIEAYRFNLSQVAPKSTGTGNPNVAFYWDGIRFVKGQYIKYPHPDRDYYGISPFSSWSKVGYKLIHSQIDKTTSEGLTRLGVSLIGALIGIIVGSATGPYGFVVGPIVTAIVSSILYWLGDLILLDEMGCIWFWYSWVWIQWFIANSHWFVPLYLSPFTTAIAISIAMAAFFSYGYLRVGSYTFYDAIGIGNPEPSASYESSGRTGGGGGDCHLL